MARKLPAEAYQLAETYQLGTPVKRHIGLGWIILYSGMIALFLLIWGVFTMTAFTPPGFDPLFVSCTGLIFLGGIVIYSILLFKALSHYAYECIDGFVDIKRNTHQVKHVLHWNDVLSTHVSSGRSFPTYYVTDINHQKFEVPYHAIWKRCRHAVANHTR